MLNRRQLRIKALEGVYAFDKSLDKNIDFQISYFLKSNKNFFKLYITCFSLLKELHDFANELHSKNQKKYINKDSDLSLNKFCNNLVLKRVSSNEFLSKKINDFSVNYWESRSELISSIWNDIIESDISIKYLNDENNKSFELDKFYLTNLFRKIIASNKKLYDFFETPNWTIWDTNWMINKTFVLILFLLITLILLRNKYYILRLNKK